MSNQLKLRGLDVVEEAMQYSNAELDGVNRNSFVNAVEHAGKV